MKYRGFIEILEPDEIYSPATIVNNAFDSGFTKPKKSVQAFKKERVNIRHTLARFAKVNGFCEKGDGQVRLRGQAPTRGWKGIIWQSALPPLPPKKPNPIKKKPKAKPVNQEEVCNSLA